MQDIDIITPGILPNGYPSIFNDVIGPVMRGPSSSHSAAALRMGKIARAIMNNSITTVMVTFDTSGSLPFTHTTQGSDMGLAGGLLGFEADNHRLLYYEDELAKEGITVHYQTDDLGDPHSNTYRITLENSIESHSMIAISTGGGMLEVVNIDGADISLQGDLYVTLVYCDGNAQPVLDHFKSLGPAPTLKASLSTFAAEVGGCQVECGAGSAMAAAGLTTLMTWLFARLPWRYKTASV